MYANEEIIAPGLERQRDAIFISLKRPARRVLPQNPPIVINPNLLLRTHPQHNRLRLGRFDPKIRVIRAVQLSRQQLIEIENLVDRRDTIPFQRFGSRWIGKGKIDWPFLWSMRKIKALARIGEGAHRPGLGNCVLRPKRFRGELG